MPDDDRKPERVQTGVRVDRRLLKVLKAVAEYRDQTLADLLEEVAVHSLAGRSPFTDAELRRIDGLRDVYGLALTPPGDPPADPRRVDGPGRSSARPEPRPEQGKRPITLEDAFANLSRMLEGK